MRLIHRATSRVALFSHLFWFIAILPVSACAEEPFVRVAILQEAESARISVLSPCRVFDLLTGELLGEWPSLKWQPVQSAHPGLRIGKRVVHSQMVLLEPLEEGVVRVNAKPYRGSLILQGTAQGNLTVINRLGLEEYLTGALASEVDSRWPMEALKAHAVVSRTMVAHRIWIKQDQPFDVTADTQTHLYYGVASERERTGEAVESTRGEVLAYHGELFAATFHANCGGHTEDAAELWDVKGDLEPLTGRPDPYCKDQKHFRWQASLSLKKLEEILTASGRNLGKLTACEVTETNRSGRVRGVRLQGTQAETVLSGKDFRQLLGVNQLRSLKFSIERSGDTLHLNGFGWGHGVGFCQWGAYGMAQEGRAMDEILSFYFPASQRRGLKGLPGFVN